MTPRRRTGDGPVGDGPVGDGRPRRDPAASMALLREVMDPPLDPGYASWSEARARAGRPRSTGSRSVLLVLTTIVLGFLLAVAAQTLRTPDPAGASTRAALIERIQVMDEQGDGFAAQVETLRGEVTVAQEAQSLDESDRTALDRAGLTAGSSPLQGTGVVLTLNDPAPSEEDGSLDRVLARDIQTIVNGLWASGAEAIAINDQRLTSTASIRFAGQAIIVDFKGLARPYVIRAIGPQEDLAQELTSGDTGSYLQTLRSEYRITADLALADEVVVPGASSLSTRVSSVPDGTSTSEEVPP